MNSMTTASPDQWCSQMDRLVGGLSSELIGCSADDLAPAMTGAMRRIVEALDLDRSTVLELSQDDGFQIACDGARQTPAVDHREEIGPVKWLVDCLEIDNEAVVLERIPDDLPPHSLTPDAIDYLRGTPIRSAAIIPVSVAGQPVTLLGVGTLREYRSWPAPTIERLRLLAEILASALHRRRQELALRASRAELARMEAQRGREVEHVKEEVRSPHDFNEIVGEAAPLRSALARLEEVAATDSTVLLLGETGTGKELFARALHARSARRHQPLVTVNCAALPPTLIESELFGHERGAFTGAVTTRQGRFELAHRGTLFLDEIGDLPLDLQAKLLRVLQRGEFERLGSSSTRRVDVRIVAATHRDLERAIADGSFRDDLYYRLSVFPIRLPALRERRQDIEALIWFLIHKRQRAMHRQIKRVPQSVLEALQNHPWPGNVRELENVIERALIHSTGDTLTLLDEPLRFSVETSSSQDDHTLSAVDRSYIEEVLGECGWRINGSGNAAERLGLHPNTLRFRMKKLGIARRALVPSDGQKRGTALARLP
jgi:formate hydrogenlyase transcriptional activator